MTVLLSSSLFSYTETKCFIGKPFSNITLYCAVYNGVGAVSYIVVSALCCI